MLTVPVGTPQEIPKGNITNETFKANQIISHSKILHLLWPAVYPTCEAEPLFKYDFN